MIEEDLIELRDEALAEEYDDLFKEVENGGMEITKIALGGRLEVEQDD